jgi:2-polyprenyl-3-methyl-5-hydroxy-6-metoxy-1,4-benzoquinol methylase
MTEVYTAGCQRLLGNVLPTNKDAPIYDAGCGQGLKLNTIHTLGYRNLEGTDLSATAVGIDRELGLNTDKLIQLTISKSRGHAHSALS